MNYFEMLSPKSEYNNDYYASMLARKLKGGDTPAEEPSRFLFRLTSNLTQPLYLTQSAANADTVDWGDGSESQTSANLAASFSHTYAAAGDYTVTIDCSDGSTWSPGGTFSNKAYCFLGDTTAKSPAFPTLILAELGKGAGLTVTKGFSYCTALTSITMADSVIQIAESAFGGCRSLVSIILPESVKYIGAYAFAQNSVLASIILPENVMQIGDYAFNNCANLTTIKCLSVSPPSIFANTFNAVPTDCDIYVPTDSINIYKSAQYWSNRADYIQAIPA